MSKAFTRESDDAPEQPIAPRVMATPAGKNYITPGGEEKLRAELDRLMQLKLATGSPPDDAAKREQQTLTQKIQQFQQTLASVTVVEPPAKPWEQVLFGATVTVRDGAGAEFRYRIVGVDETDLERDWISWLSPVARALLKAKLGQRVQVQLPGGTREWEITGIIFE